MHELVDANRDQEEARQGVRTGDIVTFVEGEAVAEWEFNRIIDTLRSRQEERCGASDYWACLTHCRTQASRCFFASPGCQRSEAGIEAGFAATE